MGTCSCFVGSNKDSSKTLPEVIIQEQSIIASTYSKYESKMIPELKELYNNYLSHRALNLLKIKIKNQELGEFGSEILATVLPDLKYLRKISLKNNGIGSKGAKKIADTLGTVTSLEVLKLVDNNINDEGVEYICCCFPFLNMLKEVYLVKNEITNVGAEFIYEAAINMQGIEILDISENFINRRGLAKIAYALKGFSKLKTFEFRNNETNENEELAIKRIFIKLNKFTSF